MARRRRDEREREGGNLRLRGTFAQHCDVPKLYVCVTVAHRERERERKVFELVHLSCVKMDRASTLGCRKIKSREREIGKLDFGKCHTIGERRYTFTVLALCLFDHFR